MASITEGLLARLQGQPIEQMSEQLGLSPQQTAAAVGAALPLLLGMLGRNATQPEGAESLFGALRKDHAGLDIGDVLGSVLGGGGQGEKILGHVFGPRQDAAAGNLGSSTGLAPDKAKVLLRWLAPLAMAFLARKLFEQRQGHSAGAGGHGSIVAADRAATEAPAPTPGELRDVLGREERQIQQDGGLGGSLLGAVLDRNRDGKVDLSDLIAPGGRL